MTFFHFAPFIFNSTPSLVLCQQGGGGGGGILCHIFSFLQIVLWNNHHNGERVFSSYMPNLWADYQKKTYFHRTVEPHYNEVLGTMKITLLYQGNKTKKYKELGPAKLPCYKRVMLHCISDLFIMRFHCICPISELTSKKRLSPNHEGTPPPPPPVVPPRLISSPHLFAP